MTTQVAKRNLTIYQGATFIDSYVWGTGSAASYTPVDLTDCSARLQARVRAGATDVLFELSTDNGGITLGGALGTIDLSMAFEDTAALSFRTGVYDLEITRADGTVRRLMSGHVHLKLEVTR